MSTALDEETFVFNKEDFEIPCDIATAPGWPDTIGPAKWSMVIECPVCNYGGNVLICDDCKEFSIEYRGSTTCLRCYYTDFKLYCWIKSLNPI